MENRLQPGPKFALVCKLCGQPWHLHLLTAERDYNYNMGEGWDELSTTEQAAQVDAHICVELLKKANQGPMGPAGPMGPMGAPGRNA